MSTAVDHTSSGLSIDPKRLERHIVPVSMLDPNPWNPNRMDDRTYAAERESIRRFGFIDPILVRPHPEEKGRWQIIDGEHRWRAATEEGYDEVIIDSVGAISDVDAKTLTVVLNETRGEADVAKLGALLVEIEEAAGNDWNAPLPYSGGELTHLLSLGRVEWDTFSSSLEEGSEGNNDVEKGNRQDVTLSLTEEQAEKFRIFSEMLCRETGETVEFVVVDALKHAAEKL